MRPLTGIMPIIACPSCNLTNSRFCCEKGFVESARFCCKTGFVANTRLFGFVWCRLLRRHLGFDSDFEQISGLKIGGWQHCLILHTVHFLNSIFTVHLVDFFPKPNPTIPLPCHLVTHCLVLVEFCSNWWSKMTATLCSWNANRRLLCIDTWRLASTLNTLGSLTFIKHPYH